MQNVISRIGGMVILRKQQKKGPVFQQSAWFCLSFLFLIESLHAEEKGALTLEAEGSLTWQVLDSKQDLGVFTAQDSVYFASDSEELWGDEVLLFYQEGIAHRAEGTGSMRLLTESYELTAHQMKVNLVQEEIEASGKAQVASQNAASFHQAFTHFVLDADFLKVERSRGYAQARGDVQARLLDTEKQEISWVAKGESGIEVAFQEPQEENLVIDYIKAQERSKITHPQLEIEADSLIYSPSDQSVKGAGNVLIRNNRGLLEGEYAHYNLITQAVELRGSQPSTSEQEVDKSQKKSRIRGKVFPSHE